MFRYELLLRALRLAVPAGITDESSAVEQLGIRPRLITGNAANLKVTYPQDFALAQIILAAMEC
jgi:2-C-methyl-D-erythritol 4-phosphate cytidylyltransferase